MARAAAKRRPPARRPDPKRRHKDPGGQRYEDTLFFNRLRTHAKWVFVLLIVVFGLGFVLFGVGSSSLGLGDILNGVGSGGGSGPSVGKSLKATEENPKDAQAWKDLATAYDAGGEYSLGLGAWQRYTELRPRDAAGLGALAQDYGNQLQTQSADVQAAQAQAQQTPQSTFGPPSTSALGRALGSLPDPITQSATTSGSTAYQSALSAYQQTSTQLVAVFTKLAKLQPSDPTIQLQLAQTAESVGNTTAAIAAYKAFVRLSPDDASAPQAKARIKALEKQQG